jgi:sensor histidine kinase regulating citrate/malate metabolism
MNGPAKFKRKVYVALAFPEIFKVAAVLLQIFDNEPTLLLLIGLLILSMQQTSLESVTSTTTSKLNGIIVVAVLLRFVVRCFLHRFYDVWLLGLVC